jgi:hypothetical protein
MPMPTQIGRSVPSKFQLKWQKRGNFPFCGGAGCVKISRIARELHASKALAPVKI